MRGEREKGRERGRAEKLGENPNMKFPIPVTVSMDTLKIELSEDEINRDILLQSLNGSSNRFPLTVATVPRT